MQTEMSEPQTWNTFSEYSGFQDLFLNIEPIREQKETLEIEENGTEITKTEEWVDRIQSIIDRLDFEKLSNEQWENLDQELLEEKVTLKKDDTTKEPLFAQYFAPLMPIFDFIGRAQYEVECLLLVLGELKKTDQTSQIRFEVCSNKHKYNEFGNEFYNIEESGDMLPSVYSDIPLKKQYVDLRVSVLRQEKQLFEIAQYLHGQNEYLRFCTEMDNKFENNIIKLVYSARGLAGRNWIPQYRAIGSAKSLFVDYSYRNAGSNFHETGEAELRRQEVAIARFLEESKNEDNEKYRTPATITDDTTMRFTDSAEEVGGSKHTNKENKSPVAKWMLLQSKGILDRQVRVYLTNYSGINQFTHRKRARLYSLYGNTSNSSNLHLQLINAQASLFEAEIFDRINSELQRDPGKLSMIQDTHISIHLSSSVSLNLNWEKPETEDGSNLDTPNNVQIIEETIEQSLRCSLRKLHRDQEIAKKVTLVKQKDELLSPVLSNITHFYRYQQVYTELRNLAKHICDLGRSISVRLEVINVLAKPYFNHLNFIVDKNLVFEFIVDHGTTELILPNLPNEKHDVEDDNPIMSHLLVNSHQPSLYHTSINPGIRMSLEVSDNGIKVADGKGSDLASIILRHIGLYYLHDFAREIRNFRWSSGSLQRLIKGVVHTNEETIVERNENQKYGGLALNETESLVRRSPRLLAKSLKQKQEATSKVALKKTNFAIGHIHMKNMATGKQLWIQARMQPTVWSLLFNIHLQDLGIAGQPADTLDAVLSTETHSPYGRTHWKLNLIESLHVVLEENKMI